MSTLDATNSRSAGKPQSNSFGRIMLKIAVALGRILALLLTLLLCLPVILLPYSTPVPAWIWILLAVVWFAPNTQQLLAAYRPEEIAVQLARAGLSRLRVEAVGDRHVVVYGLL